MPKYRIALLTVLAGVLVFGGYLRYREFAANRIAQANNQHAAATVAQWARFRAGRQSQFHDNADDGIPAAYPRPPSDWLTNEQHFYEHVLAGHHYDTLVIPFQVDGMGFDRATRLLMTAELANAIAQSTSSSVPDPYTMDKVFGEGRRSIQISEISRIANLVGARHVVWGAAGHDSGREHSMHLKIVSKDLPQGATFEVVPIHLKLISGLSFDSEHSPIEAFEQRLPEIVQSLGLAKGAVAAAHQDMATNVLDLSSKPSDMLTGTPNATRDGYVLSLLHALTPARIEGTRNTFAVKAYMATTRISPAAPEYRALRTRALMMLGYRQAALKVLGSPVTDEELELSAVLSGNLPQARLEASKASEPLKRIIAYLDVNRIESDFDVLTSKEALEAAKSVNLPGQVWPYLVARASTDWDRWSQFDNAPIKALMDTDFPVAGYTLQELVRGQFTVGDAERLRSIVDLSVFNQARAYLENNANRWCCDLATTDAKPIDYLELLSAIAHDNLIRRVNFLATIQGSPEEAVHYADTLQSVYKGDPYYSLARATAEYEVARQANGAEQDGLFKSAYENAFNAMFWEQGQSAVSSEALDDLAAMARQEYGVFDNFYSSDIPFHPLYRTWGGYGDPAVIHANGQAALDNATSQFGAVRQFTAYDNQKLVSEASVNALANQIEGRFIGSPERNIFLADQRMLLGDDKAAAALLRDNIKQAPLYRESYFNLGKLTFESGQPSEAADIFLSYPGLSGKSTASPVEIANAAYDMGNFFYGSGDLKLAIPFYRIAARQQSGAGGEMASAARLKVLESDIDGAAALLLERAQRYNDFHAYRDLLSIMHAAKQSQPAWSGFTTIVRQKPDFSVWESVVVGHHMDGSSEAQVTKWAEQPDLQAAGNMNSYATSYLVLFATTDRIPSASLGATIASIDRPTWQFEDGARSVVRPDADDPQQHLLGPQGGFGANAVLPNGAFDDPKKHQVRSRLSYFVDAYRDVALGSFAEAKKTFEEAANLYDLASIQSSYMLPYFALASAKAGSDVSDVSSILARLSPQDRGFDYQLASAVLAAIRGQTSESMAFLRLARDRLPRNDDERPTLPRYTYGEICETLYEVTNDPKFRDEALDWTRSRERAEPWQSWTYALDAVLAPDPADRDRALAMLFYLDPGSRRLSTFKKPTVDAAVQRFGENNIFKPRKPAGPKPTTT